MNLSHGRYLILISIGLGTYHSCHAAAPPKISFVQMAAVSKRLSQELIVS
jgi:hypothetical protein